MLFANRKQITYTPKQCKKGETKGVEVCEDTFSLSQFNLNKMLIRL